MTIRNIPGYFCLIAFSLFWSWNASAKPFEFPTLSAGTITAEIPDDWFGKIAHGAMPDAVTVRFTTPAPANALILWTVMVVSPGSPLADASAETIRSQVAASAAEAAKHSVEKEPEVRSFDSPEIRGAYFAVTDAAPAPGEYKYMAQGTAAIGSFVVTFTALSNDHPENVTQALSAAIRSLRIVDQK